MTAGLGNREAFSLLVNRYYASVLRLCIRLLSDPVEAQDVAQEAVLQGFLGLDRLQRPARFGAWLHAIAAHIARSVLHRQRTLSLKELDELRDRGLRGTVPFPSLEQYVG